jgi:hypothetical protein
LYFTVFYCNYKGLAQAAWPLGKVFAYNSILMNIWCFISLALLESLTKASKPAATTRQNRPKGHGKMQSVPYILYFKLIGHYNHILYQLNWYSIFTGRFLFHHSQLKILTFYIHPMTAMFLDDVMRLSLLTLVPVRSKY